MNNMDFESLDIEEDGPLRTFLDDFIANGMPDHLRHAFATWLEKQIVSLQDQRDEAVRDYRELKDEHPDQLPIPPEAATFYSKQREEAQIRLNHLTADPRVAYGAIQFEPYNGFVCVLVPKLHDLSDLADLAEIQDGRKQLKPKGKAGPRQALTPSDGPQKARQGASPGEGGGSAPSKGATARVWEIADRIVAAGPWDRSAIISACVAEGINQATAGTQYSKWKKARGL